MRERKSGGEKKKNQRIDPKKKKTFIVPRKVSTLKVPMFYLNNFQLFVNHPRCSTSWQVAPEQRHVQENIMFFRSSCDSVVRKGIKTGWSPVAE